MKRLGCFLFSVIFLSVFSAFAVNNEIPSVSNLSFVQDKTTKQVTVTYSLSSHAYVRLDVLTNNVPVGRHLLCTLSGDVSKDVDSWISAGEGKSILWDARKDWPDQHVEIAVAVTATQTNTPHAKIPGVYMVMDLSEGPDAEHYPVSYSLTPPDPADISCTSNQLWLKRVEAGTYYMGQQPCEIDFSELWQPKFESQHKVSLTKPFFVGVFPVTRGQYQLVMGTLPSAGKTLQEPAACCPVGNLSWSAIRGEGNSGGAYDWPTHSGVDPNLFFGRLCERAGNEFDLPTDAQCEYFFRAGTTTAWNNGMTITNKVNDAELDKLGWYKANSAEALWPVGRKLPNAWGLYDTQGGVFEWCLDWTDWGRGMSNGGEDPRGTSSGQFRIQRGGAIGEPAHKCRSAYRRGGHSPGSAYPDFGFRVTCVAE